VGLKIGPEGRQSVASDAACGRSRIPLTGESLLRHANIAETRSGKLRPAWQWRFYARSVAWLRFLGDHECGGVTSLKNDGLDPVGETLKPIATGPSLVNLNNEVNIPWQKVRSRRWWTCVNKS
jgi:hypothetical protein